MKAKKINSTESAQQKEVATTIIMLNESELRNTFGGKHYEIRNINGQIKIVEVP
jgi:hypothetical protein